MEKMSTIPAPVEAMIFGQGSFFGSCQAAANNFEPFFQSAMVGSLTGDAQSVAVDEQSPEFNLKNFPESFSKFIEEYGENKMLKQLQEILGEEAGTEAFELALLVAENDDILGQLSPEDQMDIWRLHKIMDMAETPFSVPKELLENWAEKTKSIFGDAKIELKQPEEPISELEEKDAIVAMPFEDVKNIRLLASEMGIEPKDVPKFKALINSLLKSGLFSSQDLKEAAKDVSQELGEKKTEPAPVGEFIEGLWELVKNETEAEIENLVDEKIASLIGEPISSPAKESVSVSAKEVASSLAKENVSVSAKEVASSPAKENVSVLAKEVASSPAKGNVSGSVKKIPSGSAKDGISSFVRENISSLIKEGVSISEKESVPGSAKGSFFGLVKENASDLAENLQEAGEDELVEEFHALLRKFLRGELTEEEKEKLKHILKVAEHSNFNKQNTLEEGEEIAIEEESDSQAEDEIGMKDPAEENLAFEDLAFEDEGDIKLLNSLFDPKRAEKSKRKGFKAEMQQASQIQQPQQSLQTEPQQMRQTQQAQHQVQPEVRAVWEGEGLKIELVNPKTGEKLQTTYETMPQKMQERINEFEVVRQVIAQAKFITTPTGEQRMTMQLRPEHLGQMDLRIILNHGEMQIHARVESVTAQSALETHIGLLREGLEKQGISLERLEVSVEQRDRQDAYSLAEKQEQREQKHGNHRHRRGREQHLAVSIAKNESSDTGRRLGYNTMEYLA
jgi:flagellar hook-length control protein FliK